MLASSPCNAVSDTSPIITLTSVPFSAHFADPFLPLTFHVHNLPNTPVTLRLMLTNDEEYNLPIGGVHDNRVAADGSITETLNLTMIEPGTHTIVGVVVSASGEDSGRALSCPISTIAERVLSEREGGREGHGRRMMDYNMDDVDDTDNTDDADDTGSLVQGTRSMDSSTCTAAVPIRILFVGMLKHDGQKTIWLRQFQHLPPCSHSAFDSHSASDTHSVSSTHSTSAVHDGVCGSCYDLQFTTFMGLEGQSGDPARMIAELAKFNVPLSIRPLPSLAKEDLDGLGGLALDKLFKSSGSVDMSVLVDYLMDRLAAVDQVVDNITPAWAKETWQTMVAEIEAFDPSILVFANARDPTDCLLTTAVRLCRRKIKVVMELPNLYPKFDMALLDVIVAPSHYAGEHHSVVGKLEEAEERGGVRPVVKVITPGVDLQEFTRGKEAKNEESEKGGGEGVQCSVCQRVGFVGRISSEKSPGVFVSIARDVLRSRPFTRFVVVGDGKFLDGMKDMAQVLEVDYAFEFLGAKYGKVLVGIMGSFDLIVNTPMRYDSETFCIANVEAMALGVPVVSFGVGGIGEYLRDGENGAVVYAGGDEGEQSMAQRVVELLGDEDMLRKLREGGRRTAERMQVERMVRGYKELYEGLVV